MKKITKIKWNTLFLIGLSLLSTYAKAQGNSWMNPFVVDELMKSATTYNYEQYKGSSTYQKPWDPIMNHWCEGPIKEMSITTINHDFPKHHNNQIFRFDSLGRPTLYLYRMFTIEDELFGANEIDSYHGKFIEYDESGFLSGLCVLSTCDGENGGWFIRIYVYKYDQANKTIHRDFYWGDSKTYDAICSGQIRSFRDILENVSDRITPLQTEFRIKSMRTKDGNRWQRTVYYSDNQSTGEFNYTYRRDKRKSTLSVCQRTSKAIPSYIIDSSFRDDQCQSLEKIVYAEISPYRTSDTFFYATEYNLQGRITTISTWSGSLSIYSTSFNDKGDEIVSGSDEYNYDYKDMDSHGNWLECEIKRTYNKEQLETTTVKRKIRYW